MSNTANEMGQGQGTLSRGAGLVAEARADIDRISSELSGRVDGLRGQWIGSGATAFMRLHTEWTEAHKAINSALEDLALALRKTESDNMSTDDAQVAPMTNLSGHLTTRLG